ncbi:ABC transporter ATP-binding protein [Nitrospirillum iridis]|uniref:Iron complex transport system ATP-binding protein n=1 Tax=Nitrospirillum iridis TaxID=765888 RepID=A0A7X0B3T4_9PROT|nr:ABC transporter ATP-binding protein [Nitrospirillum iridis]MBB6253896.1 iron complex transport system ATP-binding protein [Nitrospirillum iridis]
MTLLEAHDIRLVLDGRPVLDGVSLSLRAGEVCGLIGPNGAGKSSLMRILAGLRRPDGGTVTLDGRPLPTPPDGATARRLAYLAQDRDIHWPLTVAAVVALGRLPHRGPFRDNGARDSAAVERALTAADCAHLRDRVATTLSGGERARVLLARVLAGEPDILLADEPAASLDPLHQVQVMALLRRLAHDGRKGGSDGRAVLTVLHDLNAAAAWCDRVVMLHAGRVVADGPPHAVLEPDLLRTIYGVGIARGMVDGQPVFVPKR